MHTWGQRLSFESACFSDLYDNNKKKIARTFDFY